MLFVVRRDIQRVRSGQLAGGRQRRDELAQQQTRAEGVVVGHDVIRIGGDAPFRDVAHKFGQDQFRVDPGVLEPVNRRRGAERGQDRACEQPPRILHNFQKRGALEVA